MNLLSTSDAKSFDEWLQLAKGYIHEDIIAFLTQYPKYISFNGETRMNPSSWSYVSKMYEHHWALESVITEEITAMADDKTARAFKRFIVQKYDITKNDFETGAYVLSIGSLYDQPNPVVTDDLSVLLNYHRDVFTKGHIIEDPYVAKTWELLCPIFKKYHFTASILLHHYVLPKIKFNHKNIVNNGISCQFMIDLAQRKVTYISVDVLKQDIENSYGAQGYTPNEKRKAAALDHIQNIYLDFQDLMSELSTFHFTLEEAENLNGPFSVGKVGNADFEELLPYQHHKIMISSSIRKK